MSESNSTTSFAPTSFAPTSFTPTSFAPLQELKWSSGEKYEQSVKSDKEKYISSESNISADYNNMKSLLFEDVSESCMRISNKREDANTKLNERSMIESINQNPFLPRNNYINDLQIQDEFLKPKNSNFNIETQM